MLAPQSTALPLWSPTETVGRSRVTEDGGIVKMILSRQVPKNATVGHSSDTEIVGWERGWKARIQYTAWSFLPDDLDMSTGLTSSECCGDKHDKHCHDHSDNRRSSNCSHRHNEETQIQLPALTSTSRPKRVKVGDSSLDSVPFEIRMGMKFTVPAMEACIRTMRVGETARFLCLPPYTDGYTQLEVALRQQRDPSSQHQQARCAHGFASVLSTHTDLLYVSTTPLELEITLLDAQSPDEFERELWEMSSQEKWEEVMCKRTRAKDLCLKQEWKAAQPVLKRNVVLLECLKTSNMIQDLERERILSERPQLVDGQDAASLTLQEFWNVYVSTHSNHALCSLKLEDYESCILSCTAVLDKDSTNAKARLRRAKAAIAIGRDLDWAEDDLTKLKRCHGNDAPFSADIKREQVLLRQKKLLHAAKERQMFAGKLN
ncbi:hypothetical protein SeMB42_g07175 [Synchytrium endobioticum]|uniref:PPIase FKBP-type domain-containing protein n=1 Tax=Synchytrium endobioticum TaxID=286115 RepID=A0A507CBM3_9FUNG|nr:hypothetical protein SeMB42_g07175 [Synchytrium endobioticum]TPX40633.1 hypothetical protein SeLEV6574_g06518 [Synchytrium endobioticum]